MATSFAFGADEALGLPPSARPRLAGPTCLARTAAFEADASLGHCDPSRNAITHYAPCNCTIVAYLHLRKCGGTAIRSLFKMQSQGWTMPKSAVVSQRLTTAWRPSEGAQSV